MKMISAVFAFSVILPTWACAQAGEHTTYTVNETTFEGYYSKAKSTPSKGLVVIIHDWDGLNDYEVKRADMLADLGYDAFAIDLYGKGIRPVELAAKKAETGKLYANRALMRARLIGGLEEARRLGSGEAVVIGYCFGGAAALELARSNAGTNIRGYVSFHGGLATPEGQGYTAETAPLLIAHGGADTSVTMQEVAKFADELEKEKVTYDLHVYSGAPHAFTVFGDERYQERADRESWKELTKFLEANLGS